MPIQRINPRLEGNQLNRAMKTLSLPYCVIIIVLIAFSIDVAYETAADMNEKFSISESQSKTCLIDFQKMSCNPLNLTERCDKLLNCVQMEDGG